MIPMIGNVLLLGATMALFYTTLNLHKVAKRQTP